MRKLMTPDEAREFLWASPKEQLLEPAVYDAMIRLAASGTLPPGVRINEHGEIVMGGGLSRNGDTAPTIRFSRGPLS